MNNFNKGFVGILVLVVIAITMIGGGAYIYSQNKIDDQSENLNDVGAAYNPQFETNSEEAKINSPSPKVKVETNTKQITTLSNKTSKIFTQADGVYSAIYPSSWTYTEGQSSVRFVTVAEGSNQVFDVGFSTDLDYAIGVLSQQNSSEKIIIGSNTFTKFTRIVDNHKGHRTYILPMGIVEDQSVYLAISISESSKINDEDLNLFLGSIKVDSSKIEIILKKQLNTVFDAQIKANVANMRPSAELYFDANNTYVGICDRANEKTKLVSIDKILDSTLKIVSPQDVYCNTSVNAYVYSVVMPGGGIRCADSTGFGDTINAKANMLSCK